MTSKQLINQLCYEYSTKNYNEEKLKTIQKIKKDLNLLEEYRKIEDELELDLITLFKALKQKHVFHKENVKIEILGIHIKSNELYLYGFAEDTTYTIYLSLKEYGKTWALTREELEDEEEI